MAYSAGTAYLQVVPSFRHLERAVAAQVAKMGREFEAAAEKSIPKGMEKAAESVKAEGRKAADDYSGAFATRLRNSIQRAYKSLPKLELNAKSTDVDRSIVGIRNQLKEIRDQHIAVEIDDRTALIAIRILRRQLRELQNEATKPAEISLNANARAAGAELDRALKAIEDQGADFVERAEGIAKESADKFGTELRKRLRAAAKNLPEVPITPDVNEEEVDNLRRNLLALAESHVGIDIDDKRAIAQIREIERRLRALSADKTVGERLRTNASAAADDVADFLRQIDKGVEDARKAGEKAAKEFSGGFERVLRKQIDEALQGLPPVTLNADSSDADRKLSSIRERLALLRDQRIGIDVDGDVALVQIRVLMKELEKLARSTSDIKVRADISDAFTGLAVIQRMADRLDGRNINLDAGAGVTGLTALARSIDVPLSRLGALISTSLTLGSTLVPIAAAASVAVAGIATAAIGAAAGIGVVALSMFGVIEAVQALNTYQQDADKSAKSLGAAENTLSNSLDGVRSAERALADARENAAYTAKQTARAIVEAQRSVANAQRDAVKAQRALIEAIAEAQRQDEDRKFSLRDNALAQRQATLDLAEAKADLDKILLNPRATAAEREQAKITFEQRKSQLEQLGVAGKRLAAEQAEADRVGVKGSERVVTAQERVQEANERVGLAQERLTEVIEDGQRSQTQAAKSILVAQENIAKSQRALTQAYLASDVAGGEALDNLNTAMGELSVTGQQFARFIFSLKDSFLSLRDAAADGFLPGFQQAITNLLPQMPRLEGFLFEVGQTLGQIAIRVVESLGNPAWQRFFTFIGNTASPILRGLVTITLNVAEALGSLLIALSPFNRQIGKGLVDLTERFARWARELTSSNGYIEFLEYVRDVGPDVLEFFRSLAEFAGRVIVAVAPVGKVVLAVLDAILGVLNSLPIPVLTAIVIGLTALSVVLLGVSGALAAVNLGLKTAAALKTAYTTATDLATAASVRFAAAQTGAVSRTNATTGAVGTAATTAGRATTIFSTLGRFLANPYVLAVGAAALAVGYFIDKNEEQNKAAEAGVGSLKQLADAYKQTGTFSNERVKSLLLENKNLADLAGNITRYGQAAGKVYDLNIELQKRTNVANDQLLDRSGIYHDLATKRANAYGLSLQDLGQALSGNEEAQKRLLDVLSRVEKESLDKELAKSAGERKRELQLLYKQLEVQKEIEKQLGIEQEKNWITTMRQAQAAREYEPRIQAMQQLYVALTGATYDATSASAALRTVIDQYTKSSITAIEAQEREISSLLQLRQTFKDNGSGLVLTSKLTDDQTRKVLQNRDAFQAALLAIRERTLADVQSGVPLKDATSEHQRRLDTLLKEIPANQRNTDEVKKLVNAYGGIPGVIQTEYKAKGAEVILEELKNLKIAQYALENNVSIDVARRQLAAELGTLQLKRSQFDFHSGGHVRGPGTETSDSITARLSNNEFVQQASAVREYGVGFMTALNEKRIPKEWLPGFRQGGLVKTYPFPVAVEDTFLPDPLTGIERNQNAAFGAAPGYTGAGLGWQWQMNLLRKAFPGLALYSGYRRNSYTSSGSLSWHSRDGGRAVDIPPRRDVFNFIHDKYGAGTKELIWLGDKFRNIFRGQHHKFSDALLANHGVAGMPNAHIHWAYDQGGYLPPGVSTVYNGTGVPEPVLTSKQWRDIGAAVKQKQVAGNAYSFEFRDTTLTPGYVAGLQAREAAMARIGRAR